MAFDADGNWIPDDNTGFDPGGNMPSNTDPTIYNDPSNWNASYGMDTG